MIHSPARALVGNLRCYEAIIAFEPFHYFLTRHFTFHIMICDHGTFGLLLFLSAGLTGNSLYITQRSFYLIRILSPFILLLMSFSFLY
ncbi:hypothetical protein V2G26_001641 [Clonostachys chloroleuca]